MGIAGMIGFFRRLIKDRRGNALLIAGAALPMIVGCAGLASDTIQWTLWKRQLQRAADSAALAAVYDRVNSDGSSATAEAAVSHDLTLNMHNWMALKEDPEVTFPDDGGAMTDQVQVVLRIQQRLPFSSMFMRLAPTITATARAAAIPQGGDPCFFATEPGTSTGLNYTGNAAIEAPDCDAFSNASGTNTSVAKGSSTVTLKTVGGVGGIQQSNNFHVGAYRPYSPALTDPFKDVNPNPADMRCAVAGTTSPPQTVTIVDTPEQGHWKTQGHHQIWVVDVPAVTHTETRTTTTYTPIGLSDGMNITTLKDADGNQAICFTSLSVGSNTTLTIPATYTGPIYINGGDATFQGNFSCAACTIVLTNRDAASPIGNIKANAGANINISPPVDDADPFKGIAIFQDRRAADCKNCNKINGHSGSIIQGAIYFPSQELEYNGTGNTVAQCTMFIARRLNFSGNSATSNKFRDLADCAAFGLPNGATTLMVRLVG
jgi:Flp pilus assembly protein TadG